MDAERDRRWTVASAALASAALGTLLLGGCVLNPYVQTSTRPWKSGDACAQWAHAPPVAETDSGDAGQDPRLYAHCVRMAMEDKAGRYATMNSGGGALLLQVAGLAAYRGFRGGHEANVAALSTGGASLYGAQQYLYRKPREAIYWSGAAAIGCAIGIADKRSLIRSDLAFLRGIEETIDLQALESAAREETSRRAALEPNASCSTAVHDEWRKLTGLVETAKASASIDALEREKIALDARYRRLDRSVRYAGIDLVTATNAIRDTVNRQLALQQPDPGELTKLLAALKLPALTASAPATAADEASAKGAAASASRSQAERFETDLSLAFDQLHLVERLEVPTACNVGDAQLRVYGDVVRDFALKHGDAQSKLETLATALTSAEADSGQAPDSGSDTLKLCAVAPSTPGATPFALKLPQEGAQKMTQGASLLIPIEGGVAPFSAIPAAASKADALVATPEATDSGEFRFKLKAAGAADAGTYAMIANDATGATRVFQVEIAEK